MDRFSEDGGAHFHPRTAAPLMLNHGGRAGGGGGRCKQLFSLTRPGGDGSRTSPVKFAALGESSHLCPVTPRATFASFPGLSLLSSAHALSQSERSSGSEATPPAPPRGEVWVRPGPETTERLFLQHSWAMTGPPL